MENNLEIVCGMRPMMNDTPSTGKSTNYAVIFRSYTTNEKKKKLSICMDMMENDFEIVCGVRSGH